MRLAVDLAGLNRVLFQSQGVDQIRAVLKIGEAVVVDVVAPVEPGATTTSLLLSNVGPNNYTLDVEALSQGQVLAVALGVPVTVASGRVETVRVSLTTVSTDSNETTGTTAATGTTGTGTGGITGTAATGTTGTGTGGITGTAATGTAGTTGGTTTGGAASNAFLVDEDPSEDLFRPRVDVNGDRIGFIYQFRTPQPEKILLRQYNTGGNWASIPGPVQSIEGLQLDTATGTINSFPDVALTNLGQAFAIWEGSSGLKGRVVDAAGSFVSTIVNNLADELQVLSLGVARSDIVVTTQTGNAFPTVATSTFPVELIVAQFASSFTNSAPLWQRSLQADLGLPAPVFPTAPRITIDVSNDRDLVVVIWRETNQRIVGAVLDATTGLQVGPAGTIFEVVNLPAASNFERPRVAMNGAGTAFTVVYSDGVDVFYRRFLTNVASPGGADPEAVAELVDDGGVVTATQPDIAVDDVGKFNIVYRSASATEIPRVVMAKYAADGAPIDEFIDVSGPVNGLVPSVSMNANGDTAVVYQADVIPSRFGIFARTFGRTFTD